jgi:hypothetical protein
LPWDSRRAAICAELVSWEGSVRPEGLRPGACRSAGRLPGACSLCGSSGASAHVPDPVADAIPPRFRRWSAGPRGVAAPRPPRGPPPSPPPPRRVWPGTPGAPGLPGPVQLPGIGRPPPGGAPSNAPPRPQGPDLLGRGSVQGHHVGDAGASQGKGAGLVQEEDVGPVQGLHVLAPLDHQPPAGGAADGGQHGHGGGHGQGAGASHHQDGGGGQGVAPDEEGEEGDGKDHREVPGCEPVGRALNVGPVGLRLLHQPDDSPEGGVGPHPGDPDPEHAQADQGGGEHGGPLLGLHGEGLAGDGGLIHGGVAVDDLPVHRHLTPGTHHHHVSRPELLHRDLDLGAVPFQGGHLGRHGCQVPEGAAGLPGGEPLDVGGDAHEEDHHQGGGPLVHRHGGQDSGGHEGVGRDPAPEGRPEDATEDGVPPGGEEDQPDGPRHPVGDGVHEPQGLPQDRHQEDHPEHGAKDDEGGLAEPGSQGRGAGGGRRRGPPRPPGPPWPPQRSRGTGRGPPGSRQVGTCPPLGGRERSSPLSLPGPAIPGALVDPPGQVRQEKVGLFQEGLHPGVAEAVADVPPLLLSGHEATVVKAFRWLETLGWLRPVAPTTAVTVSGPSLRASRMPRREGSAKPRNSFAFRVTASVWGSVSMEALSGMRARGGRQDPMIYQHMMIQ